MKKFTQMLFALLLIGIVLPIYSAKADTQRMYLFEAFTSASDTNSAKYYRDWDKVMLDNESFLIPIKFSATDDTDSLYLANPTINGGRDTYYDIDTLPYYCVNGTKIISTLSDDLLEKVKSYKGVTSPYTIKITQTNQSAKVTADVNIAASTQLNGKVLRVALIEWTVNYKGLNKVSSHRWVVRDLVTVPTELTIAAGDNSSFPVDFTSISKYQKSNLYIVAFIQDEATKEVLQAGTNLNDRRLSAEVSLEAPYYQTVNRNSNITKVFKIKNLSNAEAQFQLSTESSFISNPAGCQVNLSKTVVTLPTGGSENVTMTVNTNDNAIFADLVLTATPISNEKIIDNDYKTFDILTNDAKYAVYVGTHYSNYYAYQMFAAKPSYTKDLVAIDATIDKIFSKFPMSQFKLVVLGYDLENYEKITSSDGVSIIADIKSMLNSNKRVMFTAEALTSIAFIPTIGSSGSFKDFIKTYLKIDKSVPRQRVVLDANGKQNVLPFTVHGNASDLIGQTLGTMNGNKSVEYPDYFSDAMEVQPSNTLSIISYYDSNPELVAGIRHEFANGKIAYFTHGFNVFNSAVDRSKLFDNTLSWLLNDVVDGAQIQLTPEFVEFRNVLVSKTEFKKIEIKNKGNKPLTIESVNLEYQKPGFAIQNKPSNNTTLQSGQSLEITVAFTPTSEGEFDNSIKILSNSKFSNETYVSLYGEAINESSLPIISVNTSSIDFDTTEVLTTKNHIVIIKNNGVDDLTIDMLNFTENDEISFDTPEANTTPFPIEGGDETEINIKFTPTNEGTFNGKLRIQSNDPKKPEVIINLTGKGYTKNPGSVNEQGKSKNGNFTMRTVPNPMVNNGSVEFTVATTPANVEMYVIDATGKSIETIYNGSSVLGSVNLPINTSKYSNGYYTIIANVNGEQISLPLIISK